LIPDSKTATKERGEKKLVVIPFFVTTNVTKLKIILFLKKGRRKNFSPKKLSLKLPKIWVWDPRSGKKPFPDPGPRGSKRQRIPDPQRCRKTI
jgi:hypothetical protein